MHEAGFRKCYEAVVHALVGSPRSYCPSVLDPAIEVLGNLIFWWVAR
jgi:hypothetical protein